MVIPYLTSPNATLVNTMLDRSWNNVTIEEFSEQLDQYLHWYNEKRIKVSLQGMSPVQYRKSLGIVC